MGACFSLPVLGTAAGWQQHCPAQPGLSLQPPPRLSHPGDKNKITKCSQGHQRLHVRSGKDRSECIHRTQPRKGRRWTPASAAKASVVLHSLQVKLGYIEKSRLPFSGNFNSKMPTIITFWLLLACNSTSLKSRGTYFLKVVHLP